MNLLITGALGHIGSKLIHGLRPGEFDLVRMIDNLSTQRYASLFNLPRGVNFNFIEDDILTADLDKHFQDIDVVIHLAAITDATSSFEKSKEVEQVNFVGTEKVLKACIEHDIRLLFPSTTSVYGTQKDTVDEECSIEDLKPQSPYAENKLKSEQLLSKVGKENGLKFIVCRFGTIFGTSIGMRFHTAVNKFCWQAVNRQPITVWRNAFNQKRPYLDLTDAVDAIKFIIANDLFDQRIYNILTANLTVGAIVKVIQKYIPDVQTEYVDTKIINQLSYNVSNHRFKVHGFEYKGNIDDGVFETIKLLKPAAGEKILMGK